MIFKGDRQLTPALTDLLNDNTVSSNKTYSSVKINNENSEIIANLQNEVARATTKENEIDLNKQDKLADGNDLTTVSDSTKASYVDLTNKNIISFTLATLWNWVKGKITSVYYPVGTVILNTGTNPSTNFGGTWEEISKGRTLFGRDTSVERFNEAGKKGGSSDLNAKMCIGWTSQEGNFLSLSSIGVAGWSANLNITNFDTYSTSAKTRTNGVRVGMRENNQIKDEVYPPYEVVSVWKRTA